MISPDTWNLRQQVFQKYGGHCTCPCGCRDTNLRHLQLDHVKGGGNDERKTIRGKNAYIKLMSKPRDLALNPLCANCHFEKTMFGACANEGFSPTPATVSPISQTEGQNNTSEPGQGVEVCTGGAQTAQHSAQVLMQAKAAQETFISPSGQVYPKRFAHRFATAPDSVSAPEPVIELSRWQAFWGWVFAR